jgi:pSer/pThr/pTyr-binding forkhead associated (FHA) protein
MWVLQGDQAVSFSVPRGAIRTVGRAQGADFILDVALVSRLHCRLEAGDETLEVIDLSSTNGTYVNDARVTRATLTTGDRLRVGRVELEITRRER